MKILLQILGLIILTSTNFYGQNKLPKNLKQAVLFFEKNSSDDLKNRIKTIQEDSLIYAIYPHNKNKTYGEHETINWISSHNTNPKLTKYLEKRGVFDYHSEVLLYAFQQHLLGEKIDEQAIFRKFVQKQRKLDEQNSKRFNSDTIQGVYIPENLENCFVQINSFLSDSTKTQIKTWSEKEFRGNSHFGLGMWIRNNWQLWSGSRLSEYFKNLGVFHPDDMSGIILNSYHRHLNHKEIELEQQIKHYQEFWENSRKERLVQIQEEFSNYKIGNIVAFNYNKGFVSDKQEEKYDDNSCVAKGIITQRNEKDFLIKVKIIETCHRKGIVYYDNEGEKVYNTKTKRWGNPPKRIIKKIKKNKEMWFEYQDWEHSF